ncbi:MAG: hypothetical protein ABIQ31_15950 [Ferruginibacter sp.]
MTEKVQINEKNVWIVIEPYAIQAPAGEPQEYFTASYYLNDPRSNPEGVLMLDENKKAIAFESPVEALEYANEKLLGLI